MFGATHGDRRQAPSLPIKRSSPRTSARRPLEEEWLVVKSKKGSNVRGPETSPARPSRSTRSRASARWSEGLAREAGRRPGSVELLEVPFPESRRRSIATASTPYGRPSRSSRRCSGTAAARSSRRSSRSAGVRNGAYEASEQFIAKNADVVERFKRAMDRSQYADANPGRLASSSRRSRRSRRRSPRRSGCRCGSPSSTARSWRSSSATRASTASSARRSTSTT